MRVLLTATSLLPSYGGPAFSVSRLASALAEGPLEVGLWAADESALSTELLPRGSAVRRLGGAVAGLIESFAPDVVHDNGLWLPHNHRIARVARAAGLPRLVSTRGMLEPWALRHKRWKKRLAWGLYQRRDVQQAHALHATADSEAAGLGRLKLSAPIRTIPNGMDLPPVSPRPARGRVRTALFLGRIYPVKGLPLLLRAWAKVRPHNWRLVVAGPDEANHRAEVQRLAESSGLSQIVSFPGSLQGEAKTEAFRQSDLFVLPSLSESFGMAIAEALAHERPVLTTTAAPWRALVERGCGWWVEPTVAGIADGLAQATSCEDSVLREMGAAGRELIAAQFGWPQVAAQFRTAYGDLVAGRAFQSLA